MTITKTDWLKFHLAYFSTLSMCQKQGRKLGHVDQDHYRGAVAYVHNGRVYEFFKGVTLGPVRYALWIANHRLLKGKP